MSSLQRLRNEANELRKQKNFADSLVLYKKLWSEFRSNCSCWDGWGYAICLRKTGKSKDALNICREVYKLDSEFEIGRNLYAWCIYDLEIKKHQDTIKNDEKSFFKAAIAINNISKQEEFSPYTKTIFKVVDYLNSKQNVNNNEVIDWLLKLQPDDLKGEAEKYFDEEGLEKEIIPDKEKWYSLMTKAFYISEKYSECIKTCEKALKYLSNFHYSNDIWIKRRLALSHWKTGNEQLAIDGLKEILDKKNEWFIQYELSEIYSSIGDDEISLKYAIDAALNTGKIENKWKLFIHIGKLLLMQNNEKTAIWHFQFANSIREKKGWKQQRDLIEALNKLGVANSSDQNILHKQIRGFWEDTKFKNLDSREGEIVKIFSHGKSGFIKSKEGYSYYFRVQNFAKRQDKAKVGHSVRFHIVESFDKKKQEKSLEAINIKIK